MFTATLAYPPSANHYWRSYGRKVVISRGGREFRTKVCAQLGGGNGPRKPPMGGRIALAMDAFPPDKRVRDIDNLMKPTLDSLQHAGVFFDDEQIDILIGRRREVVKGGRLDVRINEFPLSACPLCGAAFSAGDN